MKRLFKILCIVTLLLVFYFAWDHYRGKKDQERRAQFAKISPGMSKADVVKVLGKPDTLVFDLDSSSQMVYSRDHYEGSLKSGLPTVVLDSLDRVLFTDFGD